MSSIHAADAKLLMARHSQVLAPFVCPALGSPTSDGAQHIVQDILPVLYAMAEELRPSLAKLQN